jgi:hypothetical protein
VVALGGSIRESRRADLCLFRHFCERPSYALASASGLVLAFSKFVVLGRSWVSSPGDTSTAYHAMRMPPAAAFYRTSGFVLWREADVHTETRAPER